MFTGIIEGLGRVEAIRVAGEGGRLRVDLGPLADGVKLGDSVAVDGACLTVAALGGSAAEFDVSAETLRRTTLGALRAGRAVNLERALRAGDRLGGHFVLGHVDGTGVIERLDTAPGQTTLGIQAPPEVVGQLILKGSVAVDGISLTIAELAADRFAIAVIPHTLDHTTLRSKVVGARVNLETDVLGKYVLRFLAGLKSGTESKAGITQAFLAEHGFM